MKMLGKSRGHAHPRKQSRRLPICIIKHGNPSYDKKDPGMLRLKGRLRKT